MLLEPRTVSFREVSSQPLKCRFALSGRWNPSLTFPRYPWSNGKAYNTMSYNRKFISSENDAKLNWDANNAIWYTVVNKDKVNPYGEYRGYKIMPGQQFELFQG